MWRYFIHIALVLLSCRVDAQVTRVVVDASGHGDYRTIQEAINSLPDDAPAPRVIFIRKGVYREKVFIEKNNLILEGEDKDQTSLVLRLHGMPGVATIPMTGVWRP
jgi:pectin methylesterase-like acyl-CoA thioesterase